MPSSSSAPETKVTFAHEIQAEVMLLDQDAQTEIISLTGDVWAQIRDSPSSVWLNEETFNRLTGSLRSVVGDDGSRAFYRRMGRKLIENPFWQLGAEAMIRLLGLSPHTLLKFVPRARAGVVRNSGKLTYSRVGRQHASLSLVDFPASTWRTGTTALMLAGTWEGVVDIASATPNVKIVDLDLEGGGCLFDVSWTNP